MPFQRCCCVFSVLFSCVEFLRASLVEFQSGLTAALRAVAFDHEERGGLGNFVIDWEETQAAIDLLVNAFAKNVSDFRIAAVMGAVGSVFQQDDEQIRSILKRVLVDDPANYLALLTLGLCHKDTDALWKAAKHHSNRPEAWLAIGAAAGSDTSGLVSNADAADAFRQAIAASPTSRLVVGHAGEGLRLLGYEREANKIFKDAVEKELWQHPLQRPKFAFWRGLHSEPLPGADFEKSCGWCHHARIASEAAVGRHKLVEEFLMARSLQDPSLRQTSYWLQNCAENTTCPLRALGLDDEGVGRWAEYSIWDPARSDKGCTPHFPRGCAFANELSGLGVPITRLSITEVYPPKTYIPKHSSPQQGRLRLMCPLVVPAGSVSRLVFPGHGEVKYESGDSGRCFWFDESFEHELYYHGSRPRASLVLDTPHPELLADLTRRRQEKTSGERHRSYAGGRLVGVVDTNHGLELQLEAPSIPQHWPLIWSVLQSFTRDLVTSNSSREKH